MELQPHGGLSANMSNNITDFGVNIAVIQFDSFAGNEFQTDAVTLLHTGPNMH